MDKGEDAQTEYCLEYTHGGSKWALNFYAVDDADAQAKVESVKASLTLLGPLLGRGETLAECFADAVRNTAPTTTH